MKMDCSCNLLSSKYECVPSLNSIAILKIVVTMWKNVDVTSVVLDKSRMHNLIFAFSDLEYSQLDSYKNVQAKVETNIGSLHLPELMKQKTLNRMRPIGLQLCEWIDENNCYFAKNRNLAKWIVFSPHGTIDERATINCIIQDHQHKPGCHICFPLACHFCVEEQVARLWQEMCLAVKNYFTSNFLSPIYCHILVLYWTYAVRNKLAEFHSIIREFVCDQRVHFNQSVHEIMIMLAVIQGNAAAVKYFWEKLTDSEKRQNIVRWTERGIECEGTAEGIMTRHYMKIIYFFFVRLNDLEKQNILHLYGKLLLDRLIAHWPFQKFFVPTISLMWDFLSVDIYCDLLTYIISKKLREIYIELTLLEDIWHATPEPFKRRFFHHIAIHEKYLLIIFDDCIQNLSNFRSAILNDASTSEKNDIFSWFAI